MAKPSIIKKLTKDIMENTTSTVANDELVININEGTYVKELEKNGLSVSDLKKLEAFNKNYIDATVNVMDEMVAKDKDPTRYGKIEVTGEFGTVGNIKTVVNNPTYKEDTPDMKKVTFHTEVKWSGLEGRKKLHSDVKKHIKSLLSGE